MHASRSYDTARGRCDRCKWCTCCAGMYGSFPPDDSSPCRCPSGSARSERSPLGVGGSHDIALPSQDAPVLLPPQLAAHLRSAWYHPALIDPTAGGRSYRLAFWLFVSPDKISGGTGLALRRRRRAPSATFLHSSTALSEQLSISDTKDGYAKYRASNRICCIRGSSEPAARIRLIYRTHWTTEIFPHSILLCC